MFKLIGVFVAALIILAVAYTSFSSKQNVLPATEEINPPTISKADGFLLNGIDGNQHALNSYIGKGKWVVLNIWATACPFCRDELFDLASFHDNHHDKDAIVLGLTLDLATFGYPDKQNLIKFAESYLIEYPLFLVDGDIASKVVGKPVNRVPITLFYNPKGKLVYELNGRLNEQLLEKVIASKESTFSTEWVEEATHVNNPDLEK